MFDLIMLPNKSDEYECEPGQTNEANNYILMNKYRNRIRPEKVARISWLYLKFCNKKCNFFITRLNQNGH